MNNQELMHYGILGMKWGVRRFQDKNGRRTSAGKKRYSDDNKKKPDDNNKSNESDSKLKLTDKQKKYLKIGAAAFATSLAVYGGYKLYKSGKLDGLINKGKVKVGSLLDEELLSSAKNGFKKMKVRESLSETLSKINPNRGNPVYNNNCTACSFTTFMRRLGFDVTAKSIGGEGKNLAGMIEECFKGARVIEGSATKFGKSKTDASEMLVKKFGQNASGVCSVQWLRGLGGHAFNWEIKDGIVSFLDGQGGRDDNYISRVYFKAIDKFGSLTLARLDNAEINFEAIAKYVQNR